MLVIFQRGWWKPWNWSTRSWVQAIFVSLLISPLITRWCCLWQVPDVALPFDVEDVIRPELAADRDAFVRYSSAMKLARRQMVDWAYEAMNESSYSHILDWDDRLDQWLIDNARALNEFRAASEMEHAGGPSLKTADDATDLSILQEMRYMVRLAATEALRRERSGDLEAAWTMHRANLNCARHAEEPGFAIGSLISIGVRSVACYGIRHWAEDPTLTVDRLQAARSEVSLAFSKRTSLIDVAKAEYLSLRNILKRQDAPNYLYPEWDTRGSIEPQLLVGKRFLLWSVGQPELTLRVARQLLLNNADQVNKPRRFRRQTVRTKGPLVFETDPSTRRKWGQLEPAALDRTIAAIVSNRVLKDELIFRGSPIDVSRQRDDAHHTALEVVLASQQYQRLHGEFPASIEQLVPNYLNSVPIDPLDPTGAPIRYRRDVDGTAVVWSIGEDGIDDGDYVETREFIEKNIGYRIRQKPRFETETP